jgi:hypothetical protein
VVGEEEQASTFSPMTMTLLLLPFCILLEEEEEEEEEEEFLPVVVQLGFPTVCTVCPQLFALNCVPSTNTVVVQQLGLPHHPHPSSSQQRRERRLVIGGSGAGYSTDAWLVRLLFALNCLPSTSLPSTNLNDAWPQREKEEATAARPPAPAAASRTAWSRPPWCPTRPSENPSSPFVSGALQVRTNLSSLPSSSLIYIYPFVSGAPQPPPSDCKATNSLVQQQAAAAWGRGGRGCWR